jgi:hypothetical protein
MRFSRSDVNKFGVDLHQHGARIKTAVHAVKGAESGENRKTAYTTYAQAISAINKA